LKLKALKKWSIARGETSGASISKQGKAAKELNEAERE